MLIYTLPHAQPTIVNYVLFPVDPLYVWITNKLYIASNLHAHMNCMNYDNYP